MSKCFHLLGLVHLPCSKKYMGCAFTQKNHKLARMLLSLGHEVIYYGAEGSDVPCTEFVQTHTLSDIRREWGSGDNRFEIGYDYFRLGFRHDFNAERTETTKKFNATCIEQINRRKRPDDFLLITQGQYQRPIDQGVNLFLTCEPGIGYRGSYAKYRAFESAFIQNFTYGSAHPFKSIDGNFYDRVIPNYFDPEDVEFSETKEPYFLFIGRVIKRKGILIAAKTAEALGIPLIIAGQDGTVDAAGWLSNDFRLAPGNWKYVGFADVDTRKTLMARARATIVATEYLEPFAGTHVESMLSGTPVITTSFGVFGGDTFTHGVHGFKCDTLDDFVRAGRDVEKLSPAVIRAHAERFLMDSVKWHYEKWFDDLYNVYLSATVANRKGWHLVRGADPEWLEHTTPNAPEKGDPEHAK
jgi:glycosyltransferase involved in cell wall biosynthesis